MCLYVHRSQQYPRYTQLSVCVCVCVCVCACVCFETLASQPKTLNTDTLAPPQTHTLDTHTLEAF